MSIESITCISGPSPSEIIMAQCEAMEALQKANAASRVLISELEQKVTRQDGMICELEKNVARLRGIISQMDETDEIRSPKIARLEAGVEGSALMAELREEKNINWILGKDLEEQKSSNSTLETRLKVISELVSVDDVTTDSANQEDFQSIQRLWGRKWDLDDVSRTPKLTYRVIRLQKQCLGYYSLKEFDSPTWLIQIEKFGVLPGFQSRGLGKKMLHDLEQQVTQTISGTILLYLLAGGEGATGRPAKEYWRSRGFKTYDYGYGEGIYFYKMIEPRSTPRNLYSGSEYEVWITVTPPLYSPNPHTTIQADLNNQGDLVLNQRYVVLNVDRKGGRITIKVRTSSLWVLWYDGFLNTAAGPPNPTGQLKSPKPSDQLKDTFEPFEIPRPLGTSFDAYTCTQIKNFRLALSDSVIQPAWKRVRQEILKS